MDLTKDVDEAAGSFNRERASDGAKSKNDVRHNYLALFVLFNLGVTCFLVLAVVSMSLELKSLRHPLPSGSNSDMYYDALGEEMIKHKIKRRNVEGLHMAQFRPFTSYYQFKSDGLIPHWIPEWSSLYNVTEEGYIVMPENGIYLIYAQLYYILGHNKDGFEIFAQNMNGSDPQPVAQCTVTYVSGPGRGAREQSCHTSVIHPLSQGQKLYLQHRYFHGTIMAGKGQSYLGFVLLS